VIESRSAFIRTALIEKLRAIGGADAGAAADALAGEVCACASKDLSRTSFR